MESKIVIGVGRLESVVCAVSVVPQHTPPQDAAAHRSTPRDLYSLYLAMLVPSCYLVAILVAILFVILVAIYFSSICYSISLFSEKKEDIFFSKNIGIE